MDIKEKIIASTDEIIETIGRLVQYESVMGEAKPGMPFGEGPAAALAEGLKIAEEMGFKTTNLDNYCGYAEMGEGKDIIGIAGHLDVVPLGDGWKHDPLKVTREGDYVYGRGTTDDKGPVIEALYAMKFVRESGVPMNKRVRLIMGCNEENGSKCMDHYCEVAEPLTMGFTPDAIFPVLHGEKGQMSLLVSSKNTKILEMKGGFVSNAVCHRCTTVIPAGIVTKETLEKALSETALVGFTVSEADGRLTIEAEGKAAHASLPLQGVNAAGCTMQALQSAGFADDFVEFYNERVGTACNGEGMGLKLEDDYGALTLNNGIVYTENGVINCTIDCRTPVTYSEQQLRDAIAPYLENEKGLITIRKIGKGLFFPKDSDLVQSLYNAYVEMTGDTEHGPMVIGGGTYAKHLPGIVAFGPEWPGRDYCIHGADEFLLVPDLQKNVEIYVKAIENMLAV